MFGWSSFFNICTSDAKISLSATFSFEMALTARRSPTLNERFTSHFMLGEKDDSISSRA